MYFYKKAMKYLLSLFLYLSVFTLCAQQGATIPKPYFSFNDSAFYVGQKYVRRDIIFFDGPRVSNVKSTLDALDSLGKFIIMHPKLHIEIAVFKDSRGSADLNLELTLKRAKAIKFYLEEKGVNVERLDTNGYGESVLLNRCKDGVKCTEDEHAVNRRVEFIITAVE